MAIKKWADRLWRFADLSATTLAMLRVSLAAAMVAADH
jgi:hypothetical protein